MGKGIDVRQTTGQIVFRAALIDGDGGLLASGDADLYLYELQTDGTLKSYDFDDNTFKTTALTTATASLTHRKGDNDSTNTGYWTHVLSTLTGFTAGNVCIAVVHHDSAGPQDQHREFQFGSAQGDLTVTDGRLETDATAFSGDSTAPQRSLFDGGMVWVDAAGTSSTTWPHGTATYPTDTIARGKTIADANDLHRLHVHGGLTLAAAMEGYSLVGELQNTDSLAVAGFSIEHSTFAKLRVTGAGGNGAAIGDQTSYISCSIYDHTNIQGGASNCLVDGSCSIRDAGYASFLDCLFGSYAACTLTLQAPTQCDIVNMRGDLMLAGMDEGVCSVSMQNGATVTINDTCTAGTITITGTGTVTDNSGEGCTVNVTTPEADAVKWLGVAPLALASQRVVSDPGAISGSSTAAENVRAYNDGTRPVLYVSDGGAGAKDGSGWGNAFDSIGAAVAAASSGDEIRIGKGTFSETIDLDAVSKSLKMIGVGIGLTTITQAANVPTILAHDYCQFESLTIEATNTGGAGGNPIAICASEKTDVVINDCNVLGQFDGLLANNTHNLRVRRSVIKGTYDGMHVGGGADNFLIQDCVIETDSTYNNGSQNARAVVTANRSYGVFDNCLIVATRSNGIIYDTIGIITDTYSCQVSFCNCAIRVRQTSGANLGDVIGVFSYSGSQVPELMLVDSSVVTTNAGTGECYDLQSNYGRLLVTGTSYDPTKTSGTIIDLDERAVQNILEDNNLDHLLKTATAAANMTTEMSDNTILARVLAGGDTSTFAPATMSQKDIVADTGELQADDVPGLIAALNDLDAAGIRTAVGLAAANLDTQIEDVPTVAEFEARTIAAADYFIVGDYTAPDNAGIAAVQAKTDNLPASPAAVGSAMTLADDAITADKYDEATAHPLKSADADSTEVARTGADGDTLEDLSDQIDDIASGAGAPITISTEGENLRSE